MVRLYRDGLRLLRLIERCRILRHGVHPGHEVIQLQLTVFVRRYGFIEIIARDREGNSGDLAVLGGLFELQVSIRHGKQQKTLHRVIHRFGMEKREKALQLQGFFACIFFVHMIWQRTVIMIETRQGGATSI